MKIKKIFLAMVILLAGTCVLVAGCKKNAQQKQSFKTIVAKKKALTTDLYFKTKVRPYKVVAVISPAEGVVSKMYFDYGQIVKKDALLFEIDSQKALEDYYSAVVSFIKAKQDYSKSKINFNGTAALWKHKLVSYESYLSDKDALEASRLNYLETQFKLRRFHDASIFLNIDKMTEKQFDELKKILARKAQHIVLKSGMRGIALFPTGSGDSKNKKLSVGSQVKKGDVLLSIGDMEGVTLEMKTSEIHVNHIKVGDKVTITGPAFPKEVLRGYIAMVGSQSASSGYGGGASAQFPVKVVVKNLTDKQRAKIHVGMTADIKLELIGKPEILIPINAVIQTPNGNFVKVLDSATGKIKQVPVVTGKTTLDSVAIDSGIKENMRVVVP
ncbi:MAG: efflux RND transporter periplasmic adaptor subunit [Gammaproteobacteria bacterium]|nr:efflux RND transporter periplasmic adaptor subunit [Gammaproteobacteria bacterium]